jgi:hypothetical protein
MTDDRSRREEGTAGSVSSAIIAAIREAADRQGTTLAAVGQEAGVGDLLVRMAEGEVGDEDLGVSQAIAISRALGLSASELFARTEALRQEGQDQ